MITLVSLANSTLRNTAKSLNQLIIIIVLLSNLKGDNKSLDSYICALELHEVKTARYSSRSMIRKKLKYSQQEA